MQRIYISVCLICLLVWFGCDSKGQPGAVTDDKLRVVTTIGMITDVVKNVGGTRVEVTGMVEAGVDPHFYNPTAKDVQMLGSAHIIFYNGLHLEAKMGDILAKMSEDILTIPVTDAIDRSLLITHSEYEELYDPHLWFDVSLWMQVVEKVRDVLSEFDADNSVLYRSNAERYLTKLVELDEYIKSQVERVPSEQRVLVTAHDCFHYFGMAYRFEVRGLQGISTTTEVGIADIQDLATFIAERGISAIFAESSVSSRSLEAVKTAVKAKGFGVEIGGQLFTDAMGNEGTPEGTYIGMIRYNIDTIVYALIEESEL
ncbi:zinc ABC transporter substrate-binding protein [Candidatus Poribacteria bacterium]|nr:zinc ABC transporter substrate-binding protein [Candidatus Poribacteria bacterium]